jgi:hypothetical protein
MVDTINELKTRAIEAKDIGTEDALKLYDLGMKHPFVLIAAAAPTLKCYFCSKHRVISEWNAMVLHWQVKTRTLLFWNSGSRRSPG